jgi:CubicO group peptidase (beta-lactamase class C family)
VTARRVLSHTTGLPNWRSKEEPLRFEFTPGERWKYSGEGYHYLQSVVTRLTGHVNASLCGTFEEGYRVCATDFGEYMTANVLRPFGMASSAYLSSEAVMKHKAAAHDQNGQEIAKPQNTPTNVARYGAAGKLLTTAADYAKFLVEVMAPKPADDYRLNAASLTEMLRPEVDVSGPVKMSWGLGWQIWHLDQGTLIAHGGDDTGFHALSMFSPDTKSGFVILTNGENGAGLIMERLLSDLINLCFAT